MSLVLLVVLYKNQQKLDSVFILLFDLINFGSVRLIYGHSQFFFANDSTGMCEPQQRSMAFNSFFYHHHYHRVRSIHLLIF